MKALWPLLLILTCALPAGAQVEVSQQTIVRSTVPVPPGATVKYTWSADEGVIVTPSASGDSATLTGPAGTYNGTYRVEIEQSFRFPIGEAPKPSTLRSLVTDDKTAGLLNELYADMAEVVSMATEPSVAAFWTMHNAFYLKMREDNDLPSNPKLGVALTARINELLGGATTLDAPLRGKLSLGLLAIAGEFETPNAPQVEPDEPTPEPTTPIDEASTPIAHDGFRVLFVEEGTTREPWFDILTSTSDVLAYLNSHVTDGPKGWRKWDQNESAENAPAPLRELAKVPRPGINCVVLTKGKRAYVYQLTKQTTDEELMAILQKFGGA